LRRNEEVQMNDITRLPPVLTKGEDVLAAKAGQAEITAVMHELKNQLCTIGLAIAALKYPDETENDRQRHLASLEAVVAAMSRQFHRLDDWLIEVGYKRKPGGARRTARAPGAGKAHDRSRPSSAVRVVERRGLASPFKDTQEM
jgi:hypothetical protein